MVNQIKRAMTQEEKLLLLQDLCARLPYGIKIKSKNGEVVTLVNPPITIQDDCWNFKPYLRSMSSMTEEEKREYRRIVPGIEWCYGIRFPTTNKIDWLNAHHFDYRGLIEKGLALEAPEGMYNIK